MNCFVTGASGFIGSNLVPELLARGHRVKALLRPGAVERGLLGQQFERVTGDLLDRPLLEREIAGCDWCFHVAASYQLWMRDYAPMYAVNVEGTRNVLEAAGRAGCRKIIYTSTVGCIGLPKEVAGKVIPANELAIMSDDQLTGDYKRSKIQAETLALELFREKGLPVIVVNPSAPVGPGDVKPTPTGQIIVDFLNRRLPAFLDTGLNWVHVRDVAVGHILAAEKGQLGSRYILGNQQGNWTMQQTLATLGKITGLAAPKRKLPYWLAMCFAELSEGIAFFTGKAPQATLAGVRMARHKMWFDSSKAIRELGLPQTPPEQAFADAVGWFRANGYMKNQ
jgi:dihydroflavonol-4-reductase